MNPFTSFQRKVINCILLLLLVYSSTALLAQKKKIEPVKTTRILFIIDASGSMMDKWEGKTRMTVAKEVLSKMVDSLKAVPRLELALRVYGHQFDKRYNNCKDTKLEVPFKKDNHESIKQKIKKIEPKGTTLISYSLEQSANDFPVDPLSRNVIILITDGIEACGGDPCALSLALQKKRIFLKPFVIGIGADENFMKAFQCMGKYYDASDVKTFKTVMSDILTQTLKETTVRVHLMDSYDKSTETNVNVTFLNNMTGDPEYDFVHYLDAKGKPDPLKVDAILSYDVVVNTIPKVIKKDVKLEGGKENLIFIKSPQGGIKVGGNFFEYKNMQVLIKLNGQSSILNVQHPNVQEKYLVGIYDVEVLTLPRTTFNDVKVEQSKLTSLQVEAPGLLNISEDMQGYGSLYQIKSSGEQIWIANLEGERSKTSIAMQPGNYKFVFRAKKSQSSSSTFVKLFEIRSGATTDLKIN